MTGSRQITGFSLPNAPFNYRPNLQLEPTHMTLDLKFDISSKTVEGTNTITLLSNNPHAQKISLDAVDFDQLNIPTDGVNYDYDNSKIDITLKEPLKRGEEIDIVIEYKVVDPIAGLYFSYPDDSYPNRCVYVASDHETERARYWLPSIDHPSVRTTYTMKLTAQQDLTILGMGRRIEESTAEGKKTVIWQHDYPCPTYITALAIGDFTSFEDESVQVNGGDIPISYYTISDYDPQHLAASFDRTPKIMRWFMNKFKVPFPWPKYDQFSLPRIFGAMENQTLVSWSDFAMLNEETKKEYAARVDSTNVHEMAHTYFGDMVVSKDWSHAWLKESWATYCSALYLEDNVSQEEFVYDMYLNAIGYFREVDGKYVRPIVNRQYHSSWEMFDSHLYPGGSWRLHMLRHQLGDELFFTAVTDYIETYEGQTVETLDFMRVLEDHSGLSLSEFFDLWILQPRGYPHLSLEFSYDSDKNQGTFTITQKQVKDDQDDLKSKPFNFDLDLYWSVEGEESIKTISIKNKVHEFTYDMAKPDYVFLDPDYKVLFKLDSSFSDNEKRALLQADRLTARIHAAKVLADTGKRRNIEALGEAYFAEEFWGVRNEFVKALVDANSRFAIPILSKILTTENDPRLLSTLPGRITKYRDTVIAKSLIAFVNRDIPPHAKANGIKALGHQRGEEIMGVIKSFLDDVNWKYLNREAAFIALANTRSEEYVDLLIDAVQYGRQPEQVRRGVILALGKLGKWQNQTTQTRIREELEDLLREEYTEVRLTVVHALRLMGAKQSIAKITKIFGNHPNQDVVDLKKTINKMKKQAKDSNKFADLTERLEKMEEKVNKLDEKLQKSESQK